MKDLVYKIDKSEVEEEVVEHFLKVSGINKEGSKYSTMKKDAMFVKNMIDDRVKLKALVSYFEDYFWQGETLVVGGQSFSCSAFSQIAPNCIKGVYIYLLTAGDYYLDQQSILNQLYADIWGTAYVDAMRLHLERKLIADFKEQHQTMENIEHLYLSNSFGPGFYGMDVQQMREFFKVQDSSKIGVTLKDDKIIVPLKSCTGLFFVVDQRYQALAKECETCMGNSKNCILCKIRNPMKKDI